MYASIQKWGNSGAVRLPKGILDSLRLRENDRVEIVAEDNQIVLRPLKQSSVSLEEIFAGWNGEMPEPYDWGEMNAPIGRD